MPAETNLARGQATVTALRLHRSPRPAGAAAESHRRAWSGKTRRHRSELVGRCGPSGWHVLGDSRSSAELRAEPCRGDQRSLRPSKGSSRRTPGAARRCIAGSSPLRLRQFQGNRAGWRAAAGHPGAPRGGTSRSRGCRSVQPGALCPACGGRHCRRTSPLPEDHSDGVRRAAPGAVDHRSGASADLAEHRQSGLAAAVRPGAGGDSERLRADGREAVASRVVGLAGRGVPGRRAVVQAAGPVAGNQRHVPAGGGGCRRERSGEPVVVPPDPAAARRGGGAGQRSGGEREAGPDPLYGPGFQDFVIEKPEHSPHYQYHLHDPDDVRRRTGGRSTVSWSAPSRNPSWSRSTAPIPSMRVDRRNETLTPLQALALLNSGLTVAMARHFAARLEAEAGPATRRPRWNGRSGSRFSARRPRPSAGTWRAFVRQHGLAAGCRLVLNLNEFVFVD
jgi:hypothetical protein